MSNWTPDTVNILAVKQTYVTLPNRNVFLLQKLSEDKFELGDGLVHDREEMSCVLNRSKARIFAGRDL